MQRSKTLSNCAVELVTDMKAGGILGHDLLGIRYSERINRVAGVRNLELRFAIEFKDEELVEKEGGRQVCEMRTSPGFVLILAVEGFALAGARLMAQKEVGSTDDEGKVESRGLKLDISKSGHEFREILCPEEGERSYSESEKVALLERMSNAASALKEMYTEDMQALNADRPIIYATESVYLLDNIAYAARLAAAAEKEKEGGAALEKLERIQDNP